MQRNLKSLASTTDARSVRFWGKISGTGQDYYIAEVFESKTLPEDTRLEGGEARGTGVNEYSYYVTNTANGAWKLLPDLDPVDIAEARTIKVCFTGNLERQIITNPFYFK